VVRALVLVLLARHRSRKKLNVDPDSSIEYVAAPAVPGFRISTMIEDAP
jgi:hypothetical protein